MYTLRDSLFTYEACLPADVRRPRLTPDRFDPQWVQDLARSLCHDEANLRIITELVLTATGRAAVGPVLHERFAELVTCGRLVLREVAAPDVYPLPDPYTEPRALAELAVDEPIDEADPKTWISLQLVHAAGLSTERLELEVTTSSGRELHGRLDARGHWRCDDIEGGTCSLRLLDHPVLHRRRRACTSQPPPQRHDILWPVGSERQLDLRAAEHHRIVIVQPPEPYCHSA
jgi:hypothetical protein